MTIHPAIGCTHLAGLRVAGAMGSALLLLALMWPEMMGKATLHALMSAAGL